MVGDLTFVEDKFKYMKKHKIINEFPDKQKGLNALLYYFESKFYLYECKWSIGNMSVQDIGGLKELFNIFDDTVTWLIRMGYVPDGKDDHAIYNTSARINELRHLVEKNDISKTTIRKNIRRK